MDETTFGSAIHLLSDTQILSTFALLSFKYRYKFEHTFSTLWGMHCVGILIVAASHDESGRWLESRSLRPT